MDYRNEASEVTTTRMKKHYAANREKIAAQVTKYKEVNPSKRRPSTSTQRKKYYAANREKIAAQAKKYYEDNKGKGPDHETM